MSETKVKERPILFSVEMIRAILDGRKSMTRRVIKPQPTAQLYCVNSGPEWAYPDPRDTDVPDWDRIRLCPYGAKGDRLWVRETWAVDAPLTQVRSEHEDVLAGYGSIGSGPYYRADGVHEKAGLTWRPSIFMPRWASRITLEVTDVRVERLQDVTEEDARAEGYHGPSVTNGYASPCGWFRQLWDQINGKQYPWSSSPWVWVVSFRRIQQ